jgi:3-deoxy-D-manno-octulosonic-acid transferase
MLAIYSLLYTLTMILLSPLFLLRRKKYAAGFWERLGNYPRFVHEDRKVIWLHCVSVGETNAARPLVDQLIKEFAGWRLVISTTTKTGQELAAKIFAGKAETVFYFPFDWKFSVRRALNTFRPSMLLLMETEIWPRLISEAKRSGTQIAIVNGRLSQRSTDRYQSISTFINKVLSNVDLALMQTETDAGRIKTLGLDAGKVAVTGNLKFDRATDLFETRLTQYFQQRFRRHRARPVIVAASTHEPEESIILKALDGLLPHHAKLFIAPRHPHRFDEVWNVLKSTPYRVVRRSDPESDGDRSSDVILLDSIGELRSLFPIADIVFVGGSLITHGGQSIIEPAAAGKAIITGPFTHNFSEAVNTFQRADALIQINEAGNDSQYAKQLHDQFAKLLDDEARRRSLGENALKVLNDNRGSAEKTVKKLVGLIGSK